MTTSLIEISGVSPPPGQVSELSLPLMFFDINHLHSHPIQQLLFYEIPDCSQSHFLDTLVPKLKHSLSLTLKHYLPLAGKLFFPKNTDNKPIFRYVPGDSVSLAVSVSTSDFDYLVGNHPRDADQFYDFVPQPPALKDELHHITIPVFSLRVTLFPGRGICLGFANLHCVGDARSIFGFLKAWSSICKLGGRDEEYFGKPQGGSLPLFDRGAIKYPSEVDSIFWNAMKEFPPKLYSFPIPTGRVRAKFVLKQSTIDRLKKIVLEKNPDLVHVSSFVVASTYAWSCLVKSGEEVDRVELFSFAADCRGRVDPPVPENYFGNFISFGAALVPHRELRGDEGFVTAAMAVVENIKNKLNNKDEVLKGVEEWMELRKLYIGYGMCGLSGSPNFDLYTVDFGWGMVKKLEVVSIDEHEYCMSLSRFHGSEGGLEFGLSLPKERMEIFAAIFTAFS